MDRSMNEKDRKMLMKSLEFIRQNPKISANQISDEFLEFWSISDFTINQQYKASEAQIIIFMFILKLHYCSIKEVEDVLNWFYFYQLFYSFQIILATTLHCRKNNIPLLPFPVFDIYNYYVPDLGNMDEMMNQYESITRLMK